MDEQVCAGARDLPSARRGGAKVRSHAERGNERSTFAKELTFATSCITRCYPRKRYSTTIPAPASHFELQQRFSTRKTFPWVAIEMGDRVFMPFSSDPFSTPGAKPLESHPIQTESPERAPLPNRGIPQSDEPHMQQPQSQRPARGSEGIMLAD